MRISRFCEARGWYEADNSIESKIFCFGDDGPSGDSSSTAASEDIGTKDVDKGPRGQDTSSDRQAYSDRFGGTSTRNFNIDRDQGFVDTDKGRVYGSPETLSAGMASGDITPSGDRATADFTAGLAPSEPSIADFDTTNVPEFDEPAGAVGLEDVLGYDPFGDFAATPVTQAARGPALGTTDYESDAYGTARTPSTTLGPAGAVGIAAARDNFRARGLDITGNINPVTGQPVPGSGTGTRDVSTTISPMDFDPFNDPVFADEAERAANMAALQGMARGMSPVEQITAQARQPVDMSPQQGRVVSETVLGEPRTAVPGPSGIASVTPDEAFNFARDVLGVDQSIPQMSLAPETGPSRFDRQARMGEVQGPMSMAPVDATRFSGVDMMRQADDVLGQRAFDEAIFGDTSDLPPGMIRAGAEIINSLESTFGGNQARKIADVANRPGGALVRDPNTGEVLGAVGPEENIRSAFMGAQDAVYVGDPRGYEQGVEIGTSILGPDTNVRDVGTQDPFTGQLEGRPGADYSTPVITEGTGDGGQRLLPPPAPAEPIAGPAEPYQGRDIVGEYNYQPRGPISYAYTGLPSLAPTTLRPSFQARGSYAPLFPMRRA